MRLSKLSAYRCVFEKSTTTLTGTGLAICAGAAVRGGVVI